MDFGFLLHLCADLAFVCSPEKGRNHPIGTGQISAAVLPVLDRLLLALGVALLGSGNEARIDDLPGHRDEAFFLQLPVEGLHRSLDCAAISEFVPEQPDRVLVRGPLTQVKARETQPGQPVSQHEFHPGVRQIVLRLQDQNLEHRHRVERRVAAAVRARCRLT